MCSRVTPVSLKIFQKSLILLYTLSTLFPTTSVHLVFTESVCEDGLRHIHLSLSPLTSTWRWTQNTLWKGIHLHFPIPSIQLWQDQSCPSLLHQDTDKESLYRSFLDLPCQGASHYLTLSESLPCAHPSHPFCIYYLTQHKLHFYSASGLTLPFLSGELSPWLTLMQGSKVQSKPLNSIPIFLKFFMKIHLLSSSAKQNTLAQLRPVITQDFSVTTEHYWFTHAVLPKSPSSTRKSIVTRLSSWSY